MSLVARHVEAAGIPTVTIGVIKNALQALPAPRNVLVRFRLGQVFGEPGHRAQQLTILRDTLAALATVRSPGEIRELPYRWRRNAYDDIGSR